MKTPVQINIPCSKENVRIFFILVLIAIWVGLLVGKVPGTTQLVNLLQWLIIGGGAAHLALTPPTSGGKPSLPFVEGVKVEYPTSTPPTPPTPQAIVVPQTQQVDPNIPPQQSQAPYMWQDPETGTVHTRAAPTRSAQPIDPETVKAAEPHVHNEGVTQTQTTGVDPSSEPNKPPML